MVEEMKKRKPGRPRKPTGKPVEPIPFRKPNSGKRSYSDAELRAALNLAVELAQANPHLEPVRVAKTIGDVMERILKQKTKVA